MTRRMFLRFFAGACLACGGLGGGGYAFLRKNMFGALPAGGLEKRLCVPRIITMGNFITWRNGLF